MCILWYIWYISYNRIAVPYSLLPPGQRQLRRRDFAALLLQSLDRLLLLVVDDALFLEVLDLLPLARTLHYKETPPTQLCAQFASNSRSNCAQNVSAFSRPDFVLMLSRMLFLSRHSKKESRAW